MDKQLMAAVIAMEMAHPDIREMRPWEIEQATPPASPKKQKARAKAKAARKQRRKNK